MESQEAPKVVDVENFTITVKDDQPTETPVSGCRGQMPASFLLSLLK